MWEDAKDLKFYPPAVVAKERLSMLAPDAVGVKHTLSGGTGSLLDKHGIDQAIQCIENEKTMTLPQSREEYEKAYSHYHDGSVYAHHARVQTRYGFTTAGLF